MPPYSPSIHTQGGLQHLTTLRGWKAAKRNIMDSPGGEWRPKIYTDLLTRVRSVDLHVTLAFSI